MVEYIERDTAIEAVRSDPMGGLNYKRILTDIPAADVVPVVRCRDCRYHVAIDKCCHPDGLLCAKDNNFCSYGKRKE